MATSVKAYGCPRCPFKTTLSCRMKSHDLPKEQKFFNSASAIEPLKCFKCANFETHNVAHLKDHLKSDHKLLKFETELHNCEQCSFQTYSNYLFLRHKLFNLCKENLRIKPEALKDTKRPPSRKKKLKRFRCDYCSYKTAFNYVLQCHVSVRHTDPNEIHWFNCAHCSFKSKRKSNLKKHIDRIHGNVEYFKCDQCPFKTKTKNYLKCHTVSKHVEDDKIQWFKCEHCSYKGKSKQTLKSHINRIHDNMEYFKCEHSPSDMKDESYLKYHKHVDGFECPQCSFKGRTQSSLKRHLNKKHGKKKCLKCDHCPFETHYKHTLREHILYKHTDREMIKWFQCEQCSYKSITRSNLTQHMRHKHSERERFQCEWCPFKTIHKHSLNGHILKKHPEHRPEKSKCLECAQCSHKTDVTSSLKCHTVSKNSEPEKIQWFQCELCPYKYTVEAYLKRHVECNHGKGQT